jgi:hypothetical protein
MALQDSITGKTFSEQDLDAFRADRYWEIDIVGDKTARKAWELLDAIQQLRAEVERLAADNKQLNTYNQQLQDTNGPLLDRVLKAERELAQAQAALRYYDSVVYLDDKHMVFPQQSESTVAAVDWKRVRDLIERIDRQRKEAQLAALKPEGKEPRG